MTTDGTQYLILDQVYGWHEDPRARVGVGLETTAEGNRQVFALPGRSSLLLDSERQQNTFVSPSGLAVNSDGRIAVIDSAANRLFLINPKRKEVEAVSAIGGAGNSPRNFSAPQGVAWFDSGAIAIADTGNHRVQIFSSDSYSLLQTWGRTGEDGTPLPGTGEKEFNRPWSVRVDHCGNVYVVDRGNRRVQKISQGGKWLSDIGRPCLADPTRLALGPDGLIAIVDPGQQAVVLISPRRTLPRSISVTDPRSAAFDKNGTLYVGDATGLIWMYTRVSSETDTYELVGQGSSNLDGEILDLEYVPDSAPYLVAIIRESFNGLRQRLWRIEPIGTFQHEGSLVTTALDSRLEKCQWHRILMDAVMPAQESGDTTNLGAASIEIESYTAEKSDVDVKQLPETSWQQCVLSGDDNPDCLVQSDPGRYLWLRVTLRSNGIATPVIRGIKAFYPRLSYLQYLPAVYQEDTDSRLFLDRFLSIFQSEFDNFDRQIDELYRLFDPMSASEEHFDWLAAWLGLFIQPDSLIDQRCRFECVTEQKCQPPPECPTDSETGDNQSPLLEWSLQQKRELLKKAVDSYRKRGTVNGVETAIQDHTGVHFARILEHFRLRRWPVLSVIAETAAVEDPCMPQPPAKQGACGETLKDYKISLPLDGTVRLWSRDFYKRLQLTLYSQIGYFRLIGVPEPVLEPFDWGAHRFTVFFPSSPYSVTETTEKVQQVVEREKPAHTQAELCPVLPRLRVGVQATVGADAVVGGISHLVLNSLSTLNYDTILSCSRDENRLRVSGTSLRPRTGISTVLS